VPATLSRVDAFAHLNPEQRAAVEHVTGPLLLVAGAGTGKTGTLAARVARLVCDGADPQRLLLLTFSRRAAHELSHRCGLLLHQALGLPAGTRPLTLPWAGTFHAIGARLLREWARPLGLAPGFTVLDRGDAEDLMAQVRAGLGQADWPKRFPMANTCLAIHSQQVNRDRPLPEVLAQAFTWCLPWAAELQQLFDAYAAAKHQQQLLDLDDLLLYWATAMDEPAVAQALGARFDQVLVDEYQDTNRLQAHILQRLKPDGRGLTVVGDDDQSIYSFRAAESGNLLAFAEAFAPQHNGPARVLSLTQNYRATPALLAASNALMEGVPDRHPKRLWSAAADGPRPRVVTVADEAAQARWVADEVLRQREEGLRLKQQAVLFRTGSHSTLLELELARRQIPFVKYGGLKFMASTHVKDLLAVLRWAHNPANALATQRCALLVAGLGPGGARRLVLALQGAAEPAQVVAAFVPPPSARAEWPALRTLWLALHQGALPWPAAYDAALAWYTPQLQRLHDDAAVRLADLQQLRQVAHAQPSGERFLAELSIDPPQASSDESGAPHRDEDYLILSTMHSAKGQEWSAVHVLNVVDGCMPADLATGDAAQIDEERRLLYVAMTRARRQLNLLAPQRFHVTQQARWGDQHLYASLSRFLTPAVLACCEQVAGPGPSDAGLGAAPFLDLPAGTLDLRARVRARAR
jgi:DNA helicase-2/ATP-dependent DNA helicase PcrA